MKHATSSLRKLLFLLAMLLCLGSAARAQGTFAFRAVHLVNGGPGVDVHFNNMAQATITNLGFEFTSSLAPTLPVGSGTVNVKIAPAGGGLGAALINRDIPVQSGYEYVAVAYNSGLTGNVKVLERPKTQLPAGANAMLRVLNLTTITNPASFDFHIDSTTALFPAISDVGREAVSEFKTLRGDVKRLYITPKGSTTPFAQVVLPLTPLSYVTLILTGNSTENLKVYMLSGENTSSYQLPVLPIEGVHSGVLPSLRVMHAWRQKTIQGTGIQALDVYVNNETQPRASNMKYRTASVKYGPLTADSITLRFTPHNEGVSPLYTAKVPLQRDTDNVVILTKTREGTTVALALKAPSTFPEGVTNRHFVRVANVSDFHRNITVKITPQGGEPVTKQSIAFLTASGWDSIPRGPFSVEAYRQNENAPFYIMSHPETIAPTYLTLVALGDEEFFEIDVLRELMPEAQVFDPAASVPPAPGGEILALHNFPNPVTGSTTIGFTMPRAGRATLALFDPMGREVASMLDEARAEGEQRVSFDASTLPAGVYLYRLSAAGTHAAGRMVVR